MTKITKDVVCKTKSMMNKTMHKMNDMLLEIHPLSSSSEKMELVGYKPFTHKEYQDRFVEHCLKHNYGLMNSWVSGTFAYTPAHKLFEVKLSHTFLVRMFYSTKKNVTYVYVEDEGFFSFYKVSRHIGDEDHGLLFKFNGRVSYDDFVEMDNLNKLWKRMYEERTIEIRNLSTETAQA